MVNNLVIDSLDIEWLNENMLASEEHNVQAEIREFLASFHNLIKEVSAENCRWKMPSKSALKTLVVCVNPPEEKVKYIRIFSF